MKMKIIIISLVILAGAAGYVIFGHDLSKKQVSEEDLKNVSQFVDQTILENRGGEELNEETEIKNQTDTKTNTDKQVLSDEVKEICTGEKESDFNCYDEYYSALVKEKGVKSAFADLRERYNTDSYVVSQCHPLTHVIGRIAAGEYQNVADAYVLGDSFCWSGYYHGVLEGVIGRIGYSNLSNQINDICKALAQSKPYSFDHYNCVHGLGHGVMAINQNELFDALKMCDNVTDSWERASCWSGVFMENVIVDNKNHFTKYLKPSDPVYPCNAVGDDYKSICYLMQTSYMLKVLNGSYEKVFAICSGIEEAHRTTCYESLGRDISGRSTSNAASTKAGCNLGKDFTQRRHCIIGAVKDFISYFHSDVQAKVLCASLEEKDLQDVCYQTTESYYKVF